MAKKKVVAEFDEVVNIDGCDFCPFKECFTELNYQSDTYISVKRLEAFKTCFLKSDQRVLNMFGKKTKYIFKT